jgi:hypothetical protein
MWQLRIHNRRKKSQQEQQQPLQLKRIKSSQKLYILPQSFCEEKKLAMVCAESFREFCCEDLVRKWNGDGEDEAEDERSAERKITRYPFTLV